MGMTIGGVIADIGIAIGRVKVPVLWMILFVVESLKDEIRNR